MCWFLKYFVNKNFVVNPCCYNWPKKPSDMISGFFQTSNKLISWKVAISKDNDGWWWWCELRLKWMCWLCWWWCMLLNDWFKAIKGFWQRTDICNSSFAFATKNPCSCRIKSIIIIAKIQIKTQQIPCIVGTTLQASTPRCHLPVSRHCSRVGGRQSVVVRIPDMAKFRMKRFLGVLCARFPSKLIFLYHFCSKSSTLSLQINLFWLIEFLYSLEKMFGWSRPHDKYYVTKLEIKT